MNEFIYNKLRELRYEVLWQLRPKTFPSLTFSFINEYGIEFTEAGEAETEYLIQVDIWSFDDYTELAKQVKEKMKEIECYRLNEYDDFEEDTEICHKILRFTHLQNNESEE